MRLLCSFFLLVIFCNNSFASGTCVGKFVNPITDICWSCVLPITIGGSKVGIKIPGKGVKGRDTKNPSTPVCMCMKKGIPTPGVPIAFWEPTRLIEITRTPYCMVGLGGISFGSDPQRTGTVSDSDSHYSQYHLHYYVYPLIYWLELITDFVCLESGTWDLAYMSEFDPTWNDDKLHSILNPEVFLFGNPLAQAACALDCGLANTKFASDKMFWCAGCLGNMYPWVGYNSDHYGGVQSSHLLAIRAIAKMHRIGLARQTSTSSSKANGDLCKKSYCPKIKKSQYKLQMTYPKYIKGSFSCVPLGMTDLLYGKNKEFPMTGQDWVYVLWRKVNCCAF